LAEKTNTKRACDECDEGKLPIGVAFQAVDAVRRSYFEPLDILFEQRDLDGLCRVGQDCLT
jgi:hypothetical protein